MARLIMRTVLLAIALSFVSANTWAVDVWRWWNLPQVAIGGGYTSTLIIRDSQGIPTRDVWVYFYNEDGNAWTVNVSGGVGNVSYIHFTLGPKQEISYALTSTGGLTSGSVQIASYGVGDLNVSLRYTAKDGQGNITDVVGILPVEPNWSWTTTVHKASSNDWIGVAVQNLYNETITVNFDFYQNGTRVPGTTTQTYTLNPLAHYAAFVNILWSSAWSSFSGVGTLRISSPTDIFTAVALRADVVGSNWQYSSLPAEAGGEQWTCSYTDPTYGAQTVTWNWRYEDGFTFTGYEQNSWSTSGKARLRGVMASDVGDFLAESNWINTTDNSSGQIVYMAKIQSGSNSLTGKRIYMKLDGTIVSNVTFTASRVY